MLDELMSGDLSVGVGVYMMGDQILIVISVVVISGDVLGVGDCVSLGRGDLGVDQGSGLDQGLVLLLQIGVVASQHYVVRRRLVHLLSITITILSHSRNRHSRPARVNRIMSYITHHLHRVVKLFPAIHLPTLHFPILNKAQTHTHNPKTNYYLNTLHHYNLLYIFYLS